jgi:hypothetical protein
MRMRVLALHDQLITNMQLASGAWVTRGLVTRDLLCLAIEALLRGLFNTSILIAGCPVLLCFTLHPRSEPSSFFRVAVTGSKSDLKVKGPKGMALLVPPAYVKSYATLPFTDQSGLQTPGFGGVASRGAEGEHVHPHKVTFSGVQESKGSAAAGTDNHGGRRGGDEMLASPFATPPELGLAAVVQGGTEGQRRGDERQEGPLGMQVMVPGKQQQLGKQQEQQQQRKMAVDSSEEGGSASLGHDQGVAVGRDGSPIAAAVGRGQGSQLAVGAASRGTADDAVGKMAQGHARQRMVPRGLGQQGHGGGARPGLAGSRLATAAGAAGGSTAAGTAEQGQEQQYDYPAEQMPVQRLYELAVEVWAGPADGPFRSTKVVSIKSKYLLLNDTGMVIEYKQKGTPDVGDPRYIAYGHGRRFAGPLEATER